MKTARISDGVGVSVFHEYGIVCWAFDDGYFAVQVSPGASWVLKGSEWHGTNNREASLLLGTDDTPFCMERWLLLGGKTTDVLFYAFWRFRVRQQKSFFFGPFSALELTGRFLDH